MATLFTRIIDGQIPGQLVWKDDVCAAFLDIEPLTPGHVLVVTREETDHWVDLPAATLAHVMDVAATVGRAQQAAFGAARVGLIVQGFEVPHAHIHVFPANDMSGYNLSTVMRADETDPAKMDAAAETLRAALN